MHETLISSSVIDQDGFGDAKSFLICDFLCAFAALRETSSLPLREATPQSP